MPVAKLMHRQKHTYSSSNSSSGGESSSLSHDDDSIQQPLDTRDINEQFPVGTAVKKVRLYYLLFHNLNVLLLVCLIRFIKKRKSSEVPTSDR